MSNQPPQVRIMKRRHEAEDDEAGTKNVDEAMDRSPTPERPKRGAPKRARTTPTLPSSSKDGKGGKDGKDTTNEGSDVDVGVLLASLPQEALLPILTSLITLQPSLKSSVLSLIPRPTVEAAMQAIAKSSRRLLDAFPYSNGNGSQNSRFSLVNSSIHGLGAGRSNGFSGAGFGFARPSPSFGSMSQSEVHHTTGMRDEYILSRLRPHIQEFVSACFSYLPYFSYINNSSLSTVASPVTASSAESHASALQSQHSDKSHPSETYQFLHALLSHIISQPPLTRSSLVPILLPRLSQEWKAWVERVDQTVNREGGMFGEETVRSWERGLDDFAQAKGDGLEIMQEVRDRWVSRVGWLVGRQPMEEL
ncbi:hypothetical protein PHLCEN_2v8775 [Hermanssonia centrifuga]|uniref:Tethering factor for nuclear proteasome STS1 n=1 Tax=Hermanssonia centrifuga TaxID=98765 RepID=A0A2R6NSF7_9APHY|nr:hypothetical protein PHLCEN_2v8775 [Hermanssonia centrifuga]